MKNLLDFSTWMERVDVALEQLVGLAADDLPDCTWRAWYDDGVPPRTAAQLALENAV